MPFLNLEIWSKLNILLIQFFSAFSLKPLNKISWNFVVDKDMLRKCAYLQEMLFWLIPERTMKTLAKIYYFVQLVWNQFSMNDREAVYSDIFSTGNIKMLHKCDNYKFIRIITDMQLGFSFRLSITNCCIVIRNVYHCHAMLERGVLEMWALPFILDKNFVIICTHYKKIKKNNFSDLLWPFNLFRHSFSGLVSFHLLLRTPFSFSSLFTAFRSVCICETSLDSS